MHEYCIMTVNAFGVRDLTEHDEEFTNLAIHSDFPDLIPEREIWIDERLFDNEGLFAIANALMQLREQGRGIAANKAYQSALKVEQFLRERFEGVKYRDGRPHKRVPRQIYCRRYAILPDVNGPITVWMIAGNLVRSFYKTDYVEGGHGYVYNWVPQSQIWIEHDLAAAELPFIVAHEYTE
jgi:hypothetical protein